MAQIPELFRVRAAAGAKVRAPSTDPYRYRRQTDKLVTLASKVDGGHPLWNLQRVSPAQRRGRGRTRRGMGAIEPDDVPLAAFHAAT
jgi:hypothetical protein